MKYTILLLLTVLFINNSFAASNNIFSYDEDKIETAFEQVNLVEALVIENDTYDFASVQNLNNDILINANITKEGMKGNEGKWQIDWPSVAIGALGCLVVQGIGCLIFYSAAMNAYSY